MVLTDMFMIFATLLFLPSSPALHFPPKEISELNFRGVRSSTEPIFIITEQWTGIL